MKIGIIGAMEEEVALLRQKLDGVREHAYKKLSFYEGQLEGQEIVLVQSGIGKVNASLTTTLLIERFGVSAIINTGVAGSLDSALGVGETLLAHSLSHHDVDVTAFDYKKGQMAGMPDLYFSDVELLRLAQEASRSLGEEPKIGLIVSGDEFVSDQSRIQAIQEDFPTARAVEMESAAIAQTAYQLETPFIIIRSISDGADDEATLTYEEFVQQAAVKSAELVIRTLKLMDA